MSYSKADSGYLPGYITGETVYSWVSRYHLTRPHPSWRVTNQRLFGSENIRLHPLMPAHLVRIADKAGITKEKLLLEGTGYSLFAYMQRESEWANRLKSVMFSDDGGAVAASSSVSSSKLPFRSTLKSCPECTKYDQALYGVPYWHCEHQLYGVWSCPLHGLYLSQTTCGDGGVNHQYILPNYDQWTELAPPPVRHLSNQVVSLHHLLSLTREHLYANEGYQILLSDRGYITPCGHLRWKRLQLDLIDFWGGLFEVVCLKPFQAISDFHFVPMLVHTTKRQHYFKHVLLLSFLSRSPSRILYLSTPQRESVEQTYPQRGLDGMEEQLLDRLRQGESLRALSRSSGRSMGYLKQLALRHSVPVGRRRKSISAECERSIWRQAFMGKHRSDIARDHGCSIGAVEQIIQGYKGLSRWRAYIRRQTRLREYREAIIGYLKNNQSAARSEVQRSLRTAYTWLYKFDQEWLYSTLPSKKMRKSKSSVDWSTRDLELSEEIKNNVTYGTSLSAIDREVGGHHWLTRCSHKLPKSIEVALAIISRSKG